MRTCGDCNLCCHLVAVQALDKPAGTWCRHTAPGQGCAIYGRHPAECRSFQCGWLTNPRLGEAWKPTVCGFVLVFQPVGLFVYVDEGRSGAWRQAPYYEILRLNAAAAGRVVVFEGQETTVVFAEEDLYVGPTGRNDQVTADYLTTPISRQPRVVVTSPVGVRREWRGAVRPRPT